LLAAGASGPAVHSVRPHRIIDLGALLAGPPSPDYAPVPGGITGLPNGALDAASLARLNNQDPASAERELADEGFRRGYGKTWLVAATRQTLIEIAEEFSSTTGADKRFQLARFADQRDAGFQGAFAVPGIPEAYGANLVSAGFRSQVVVFRKGNLLFIVGMGSFIALSPDLVVAQARTQYDHAPRTTVSSAPRHTAATPAALGLLPVLALAGIVLAAIFIARAGARPPQTAPLAEVAAAPAVAAVPADAPAAPLALEAEEAPKPASRRRRAPSRKRAPAEIAPKQGGRPARTRDRQRSASATSRKPRRKDG